MGCCVDSSDEVWFVGDVVNVGCFTIVAVFVVTDGIVVVAFDFVCCNAVANVVVGCVFIVVTVAAFEYVDCNVAGAVNILDVFAVVIVVDDLIKSDGMISDFSI